MRKISITILIMVLILSLICSFSFATTVTASDIKTSFNKIFNDDITIKTVNNEEGTATSTSSSKYSEEEKIITDSSITFISKSDDEKLPEYKIKVDYVIENNIVVLKTQTDYATMSQLGMSIDEMNLLKLLFPMLYTRTLEDCYISVAEALNLDLSLAYTYYNQKKDKADNKDNITDSVFNYTRKVEGEENIFTLEINLDEMSKIDSSKIDKIPYSTVTLGKKDVIEDNNINTNVNTQNTNTNSSGNQSTNQNNTNSNNANTVSNTNNTNNTAVNSTVDKSQANKEIPKTGSNYMVKRSALGIIFIALASLICFVMYDKRLGMKNETK